MKIDILSLFPEMFHGFLSSSLLGKAIQKKIVDIEITNFRQFAASKHHTVDDTPYGGGGGMVLKPEPIFEAVEFLKKNLRKEQRLEIEDVHSSENKVVLLCPQGETFTQQKAIQFSTCKHLIFICGHYEGFDERIREHLVTDEISIGDYVLMGGELPAMVISESIVRLLPGVLGNQLSSLQDSFSDGLLEYPQYTKPSVFRNWEVPDVLLSGNHEHIKKWRKEQSLLRTQLRRPDLIDKYSLTTYEREWLEKMILLNRNNFLDK